jgi:HK97 gp10 family phage protein
MAKVTLNLVEMKLLLGGPAVMGDLQSIGEQVAERAASAAPKATGAGAASIHAEVVKGEVHVGWTPEAFYMLFSEVGTSKMSARPFLRPALDGTFDL